MATLFLFFVFSVFGLSLFFMTQLYLKAGSHRKNSILMDYASENGIKEGFDCLSGAISLKASPQILTQSQYAELEADAGNEGTKTAESAAGLKLPRSFDGGWKDMAWNSNLDWALETLDIGTGYYSSSYKITIEAKGRLKNFAQERRSALRASMGILTGQIPLPCLALHIDRKPAPGEETRFLEDNHIAFLAPGKNPATPSVTFSEQKLIPGDATPLLNKALKLEMLYPQKLPNRILRIALGLEESEAAVPEGVYLVQDDSGPGGIFVQGDLKEMILAIDGGSQAISFRLADMSFLVKFNPREGKTTFISPGQGSEFDFLPNGVIIVSGEVQSLCGGTVDIEGKIIASKEEIPSILQGVRLTIVSSDKVTITSHLIRQGVDWEEGIPAIQDKKSQLFIFSSGFDLQDETEREGKIVVAADSPDELKIHASLTAGEGIVLEGEKKNVQILGSLQAADYSTGGSSLEIAFDERLKEGRALLEDVVQSTEPLLFISYFKALSWEEY